MLLIKFPMRNNPGCNGWCPINWPVTALMLAKAQKFRGALSLEATEWRPSGSLQWQGSWIGTRSRLDTKRVYSLIAVSRLPQAKAQVVCSMLPSTMKRVLSEACNRVRASGKSRKLAFMFDRTQKGQRYLLISPSRSRFPLRGRERSTENTPASLMVTFVLKASGRSM